MIVTSMDLLTLILSLPVQVVVMIRFIEPFIVFFLGLFFTLGSLVIGMAYLRELFLKDKWNDFNDIVWLSTIYLVGSIYFTGWYISL